MANVPAQKKVADLVNATALSAQLIRGEVAKLKALRTLFLAANPSVVGTPLAGNLAALSASIDVLDTQASLAVWSAMIAAYVPSHQGNSL